MRDFGDGFAAILLPVYLLELGFAPLGIGVLATTALLGSALLTFGIGLVTGGYSVVNGQLMDHRGQPVMVDGKPVYVIFTTQR